MSRKELDSLQPYVSIPNGFKQLLEELTLEILRSQPADIVEFAAEYLQKKLHSRGLRNGETFNSQQQEKSDKEMKRLVNHFLPQVIVNNSDDIPESTKKQYSNQHVRHNKAAKTSDNFNTEINPMEEAAAVRIQAGFRGHLTRERLKRQHRAATAIQKQFREIQQHKILQEENEVFPLARTPGELQVLNELYRARESFSFNFADTPLNQFHDDDLFFDSESDEDIDRTIYRLQTFSNSFSRTQELQTGAVSDCSNDSYEYASLVDESVSGDKND